MTEKIGFWAAIVAAATFIIYTGCFVGILLVSPLFLWTDMADYVRYVENNRQLFKDVAQAAMIVFGLSFVVILSCLHELAPAGRRVYTRIASNFGLGFALLVGLFYFVQLSTVKQALLLGQTEDLRQFVQANPTSALSAVNMLGWTLFLGLATLFLAPVFSGQGSRLSNVIRYALLINGVACLVGGAAYLLQIQILIFLCITLLMGGAMTVVNVCLTVYFNRVRKQPQPAS